MMHVHFQQSKNKIKVSLTPLNSEDKLPVFVKRMRQTKKQNHQQPT